MTSVWCAVAVGLVFPVACMNLENPTASTEPQLVVQALGLRGVVVGEVDEAERRRAWRGAPLRIDLRRRRDQRGAPVGVGGVAVQEGFHD